MYVQNSTYKLCSTTGRKALVNGAARALVGVCVTVSRGCDGREGGAVALLGCWTRAERGKRRSECNAEMRSGVKAISPAVRFGYI